MNETIPATCEAALADLSTVELRNMIEHFDEGARRWAMNGRARLTNLWLTLRNLAADEQDRRARTIRNMATDVEGAGGLVGEGEFAALMKQMIDEGWQLDSPPENEQ